MPTPPSPVSHVALWIRDDTPISVQLYTEGNALGVLGLGQRPAEVHINSTSPRVLRLMAEQANALADSLEAAQERSTLREVG